MCSRFFLIFLALFLFLAFFSLPQKTFAEDSLKINEVLVHPSSGNKEWVELFNSDFTNLSQYWIDDDTDFINDTGNSSKKSLQDISASTSAHPYLEVSSMFNNDGDYVVLFAPDGTIVDEYQYTEDPGVNVAIGRSPDGIGEFAVLQTATKGDTNSNSVPTSTPTPAPTNTPVPTARPTATPTPKSANTPTKSLVLSPTGFSKKDTISSEDAVLGTMSAEGFALLTPTPSPTVLPTKVAGAHINLWTITSIILGFCLLASCGILIFLNTEKGKELWKRFF